MGIFHGQAVLEDILYELASSLLYSEDDGKVDEAIELLESLVSLRRDTQQISKVSTLSFMSSL